MKKRSFQFKGDETYPEWVQWWRTGKKNGKDYPLFQGTDNYNKVRAGKAMEYWVILYELFGKNFVRDIFISSIKRSKWKIMFLKES